MCRAAAGGARNLWRPSRLMLATAVAACRSGRAVALQLRLLRGSRQGTAVMSDKTLILEALDALALALTEHEHQWTYEQRSLYEQAVSQCEDSPSNRRLPVGTAVRQDSPS